LRKIANFFEKNCEFTRILIFKYNSIQIQEDDKKVGLFQVFTTAPGSPDSPEYFTTDFNYTSKLGN